MRLERRQARVWLVAMVGLAFLLPSPAEAGRDDPAWDRPPAKQTVSEPETTVPAAPIATDFVPPPRRISDITAILDQERRTDEAAIDAARAVADRPAPATDDVATLARFYFERGRAANLLGRARQEVADYRRALELGRESRALLLHSVLLDLGLAEVRGGNFSRGLEHIREAVAHEPVSSDMEEHFVFQGHVAVYYLVLAHLYAEAGDPETAKDAADAGKKYWIGVRQMLFHPRSGVGGRAMISAYLDANVTTAEASILEAEGKLVEAEALRRRAVEGFTPFIDTPLTWQIDRKNSPRFHSLLVG